MNSFILRNLSRKICCINPGNSIKSNPKKVNSVIYEQRTNFTKKFNNGLIFGRQHNEELNKLLARTYSKSKDKKKQKGAGNVVINEVQIAELVNVISIKTQMEHSIEHMKENFSKYLSLRSTAGSIESIPVFFDGTEHKLQELAQINRKSTKTVVMNMSTFPQAIPEVLKAILKSGLNLNPQQDGTTIYIPIPKITKEHRENLCKNAKQYFTECKTSIRDIQLKYTKQLKKKESVSEDQVWNVEQQLKAIADKYIAEGEQILKSKQKELLGD